MHQIPLVATLDFATAHGTLWNHHPCCPIQIKSCVLYVYIKAFFMDFVTPHLFLCQNKNTKTVFEGESFLHRS